MAEQAGRVGRLAATRVRSRLHPVTLACHESTFGQSIDPDMAKPNGWWTTHPTILTVTVAGCWDSNGDGIGDFEGIRRHLDELIDMGITGLRFQHVTRFDGDFEWYGLVAQDWFDVDPVYGTMADFERLMADCRARDFAIMVMAVPEYLGWCHPDYLAAEDARAAGRNDPRIGWFGWEDDGSVTLTWSRPGPDLANPSYVDAYLKHVAFWMDKGIAGWDVDAPTTWHHFNLDAVRAITRCIKARGGFVTSENLALEHDIIRQGGFNAGTGVRRIQLYHEVQAMLPEIERQKADPHSPFGFFKRMMALRAREKALAIGDMQELPTDHRRPVFAALRTSEDSTERAVTVFNFDVEPCRVRVTLGAGIDALRNYLSGEVIRPVGGTLTVDLGRFGFKLFAVGRQKHDAVPT